MVFLIVANSFLRAVTSQRNCSRRIVESKTSMAILKRKVFARLSSAFKKVLRGVINSLKNTGAYNKLSPSFL